MELCKSYELPVEGTCGGMAMCASCQCYVLNSVEIPEKGDDEDAMLSIINKLKRSREENIKELAETLENHFYDRNDDGRNSSETRSKDKKTSRSSR
jgi:ferredoxin